MTAGRGGFKEKKMCRQLLHILFLQWIPCPAEELANSRGPDRNSLDDTCEMDPSQVTQRVFSLQKIGPDRKTERREKKIELFMCTSTGIVCFLFGQIWRTMIFFSIVAYGQSLRVHRIRWWADPKTSGTGSATFSHKKPWFPQNAAVLYTNYIGEKCLFINVNSKCSTFHSIMCLDAAYMYISQFALAFTRLSTRRRNCFTLKTMHLFPFELRMFSMPKCQLHHTPTGVPKPQARVPWKKNCIQDEWSDMSERFTVQQKLKEGGKSGKNFFYNYRVAKFSNEHQSAKLQLVRFHLQVKQWSPLSKSIMKLQ